ncbi:MAG: PHP domain-containing protein [Clostridia bacterium]|jgi:putative hydrolase|nr:PHP domain-containing protein [Clostridia bacterium]MBT7122750.1 PHP domain-containing protein [Clostridia bacterium]
MRLSADYHTHTRFSHASGSVEDNVRSAIAAGLETVGIADHSIAHALYGIKKRRLNDYVADINRAKRKYESRIEVRCGIELNLIGLDGSTDMPSDYDFDLVILGYHKAAICKDFATTWQFFTGADKQRITDSYVKAIQKGNIDIVAHPGYGVPVDYTKIAKACSEYGTWFEINNKHADLTEEDIAVDTKFVVSSDAHCAQNVGRAPRALELIKRAGIGISRIVNVEED